MNILPNPNEMCVKQLNGLVQMPFALSRSTGPRRARRRAIILKLDLWRTSTTFIVNIHYVQRKLRLGTSRKFLKAQSKPIFLSWKRLAKSVGRGITETLE